MVGAGESPSAQRAATLVDAQERVPVYQALLDYQQQKIRPLHMPAHKGVLAPDGQQEFLTPLGLACDLPSMDATDNWFHPQGCIAEAQQLAAELYGAAHTFYLVNGSTIGVQAMMLAALNPGEKVLLSRAFHFSVFSALVLSGAVPTYLPMRWLESAGVVPPTTEEIESCLTADPQIKAVLLTRPTYYGLGRSIVGLAQLCRKRGVKLLVDEAHGAHLPFLPSSCMSSALKAGADAVVQSVHKMLGSLIGTAQLHLTHGSLIEKDRLQSMLNLLQSTSSSYLLLASLDLTRRWMWREGERMFQRSAERATLLRKRLAMIEGISVLDAGAHPELAGCAVDPLRLVVDVSSLGLNGYEVERRLQQEFQILGEFCDSRNVIYVLGPADDENVYFRLEQAFKKLAADRRKKPNQATDEMHCTRTPSMVLAPRQAAFRASRQVPLHAAKGRVCAEMITAYPPGIPLICPGEEFSQEVLATCEEFVKHQTCVFARDSSLKTVSVIAD